MSVRAKFIRGMGLAAGFLVLCFLALLGLTAGYVLLAMLSLLTIAALDWLLLSGFTPKTPWLGWGIAGALLGGAFAFWTIAPAYGLRRYRPLIPLAPLLLLLAIALARGALSK